jgi:hypothetical protein
MQKSFGGRRAESLQNVGVVINFQKIRFVQVSFVIAACRNTDLQRIAGNLCAEITARAENPAAPVKFASRVG